MADNETRSRARLAAQTVGILLAVLLPVGLFFFTILSASAAVPTPIDVEEDHHPTRTVGTPMPTRTPCVGCPTATTRPTHQPPPPPGTHQPPFTRTPRPTHQPPPPPGTHEPPMTPRPTRTV